MRKSFTLFFLASCFISAAQIPDGYYSNVDDQTGEALKTALYNIIKGHTEYSYTSTSTDTWDILKEADRDPNNSNNVIGIYSNFSMDAAAEYNSGSGWSREHVWAKSRGDFGTDRGAGTDCHHLRAEDVSTNSARSNRNFDECTVPYVDGSGATESFTSSEEFVWKPRAEVKGDVSRMIFYMATRYEGENGEPDLELTETLLTITDKSPLHSRLSTLLQWHEEDPVSEAEMDRNDIIYGFQNNRNPFIDHPEYVNKIWGEPDIVAGTSDDIDVKIIVFPNPGKDFLTIRFSMRSSIQLINSGGQVMYETEGVGDVVVDTSKFPAGVYFVLSDDSKLNQKVVIVE